MRTIQPPKKSESIEVRLGFEAKQAFIAACKAERRTASEVIRGAIAAYVDGSDRRLGRSSGGKFASLVPKVLRAKRVVALSAAGALVLGALAVLPSAAAAGDNDPAAAFSRLDRNGDGVLSYEEFLAKSP